MTGFDAVLDAAKALPDPDRLRLIDALWDTVPPDVDAPFSDAWTAEIKRRVAEFDAGKVQTIPWSQIRDEAFARIGHAQVD